MSEGNARLFAALAENLKLPLVQIAQSAELGLENTEYIQSIAKNALKIIDGYQMSLKESDSQFMLPLEPVAVPLILLDVANDLSAHAGMYDCKVVLDYSTRLIPAMANKAALKSALLNLGQGLISATSQTDEQHKSITIAAHHSANGIVAGIFSNMKGINKQLWYGGKSLYGKARIPIPQISGGSPAGIFIADKLFEKMSSTLRLTHHNNLPGLAATLITSSQLKLV